MFFVLCEEWKRRLLLFFGCGAPFLADVSYFLLTFERGKAAKIREERKCKNNGG
jgi:hypothetical protein